MMLEVGWVDLREITGHDESAVAGSGLFSALTLIDHLLVARPAALVAPGEAARLTSAVRDRVLAGVYQRIYSDSVSSSPRCNVCGAAFDMSFMLSDLLKSFPMSAPPPDGWYRTKGGVDFRLPTGEDELAVLSLPPSAARHELLRRCTRSDSGDSIDVTAQPEAADQIEAAMEAAAPLLNVDLSAQCPECGTLQKIRFDMGTYLLGRLAGERRHLAYQVHLLATAYHWGLQEILSLTRSERLDYVALITAEAKRKSQWSVSPASGTRRKIS